MCSVLFACSFSNGHSCLCKFVHLNVSNLICHTDLPPTERQHLQGVGILSNDILSGHVVADGESVTATSTMRDKHADRESNREQLSNIEVDSNSDSEADETDTVLQHSQKRPVSGKTP